VHYRKFDIKQEDTLEQPQHLNDLESKVSAHLQKMGFLWS
jgi:hypothetical protein